MFRPEDGPGSSFTDVLRRVGMDPFAVVTSLAGDGAVRHPPRHDHRRHPLRRWGGHGRRPPSHRRFLDRPSGHGEGPSGRPPQRCRHRRFRRSGHGDGSAVPAPAGALREGGGHRPQPRGQGQPALGDGPLQSGRWPCRVSSLSHFSPATTCGGGWGASTPTTRPVGATRRPTSTPTDRADATPGPPSSWVGGRT